MTSSAAVPRDSDVSERHVTTARTAALLMAPDALLLLAYVDTCTNHNGPRGCARSSFGT